MQMSCYWTYGFDVFDATIKRFGCLVRQPLAGLPKATKRLTRESRYVDCRLQQTMSQNYLPIVHVP